MSETIAIPETVSLPSETLIQAVAELCAVETLLSRLWGYQDGGEGNIADRITAPAWTLLFEAFPGLRDSGHVGEDLSAIVDAKADEILATWLRRIGNATPVVDPIDDLKADASAAHLRLVEKPSA